MGKAKIWLIYFFGVPRTLFEYIVSVDLSNIWRQHLGKIPIDAGYFAAFESTNAKI